MVRPKTTSESADSLERARAQDACTKVPTVIFLIVEF
jgi:hypothetical protein